MHSFFSFAWPSRLAVYDLGHVRQRPVKPSCRMQVAVQEGVPAVEAAASVAAAQPWAAVAVEAAVVVGAVEEDDPWEAAVAVGHASAAAAVAEEST